MAIRGKFDPQDLVFGIVGVSDSHSVFSSSFSNTDESHINAVYSSPNCLLHHILETAYAGERREKGEELRAVES